MALPLLIKALASERINLGSARIIMDPTFLHTFQINMAQIQQQNNQAAPPIDFFDMALPLPDLSAVVPVLTGHDAL